MAPLPAEETSGEWLRALLGGAAVILFWLPAIMLVVAFFGRRKRPVAARRLAGATMVAAVVAVGVGVGSALVQTGGHDVAMAFALGVVAPIIAIWQAAVFCLAWVLSREPRASRRSDS